MEATLNDLQAGNAQLQMTITIKRAATGLEETYTLVGTPLPETPPPPPILSEGE